MPNARNVTTRLVGRTLQFMECPNPQLSNQLATIEGTYVEDGRLMLVALFTDGRVETVDARHVTVLPEEDR
jgi:hypothetical protein